MFIIAGVINSIMGGFTFLLAITILLMKSIVRTIITTGNTAESLVEEMVKSDASYKYLESYTQEQIIDFVWGILTKMMLVAIVIAVVVIVFAVINFIFSKKCESLLNNNKKLCTCLVVFTWVLMTFNIASIFTTLGVYLKHNNVEKNTISGPTDGKGYSRY